MKKRIFALLLALVLVCLPLLSACAKEVENSRSVTLYVYNWGEYISDGYEDTVDVNGEFETYCREVLGKNVKVNYSTFSSNEDMYAKVSSGAALYDVIIPSDYMIERMIKEGRLLPLHMENIPNYAYIRDDFKGENVYYEPRDGKIYSVPYFYGEIGVIYNTERVPEDTDTLGSWDLLWDERFDGEILQINNSRDAFGSAFYKLGYSVNDEENTAHWQEALELLKQQKKLVQGYVMDEVFYKMKSGSASIAPYYAGDFLTMYEYNDALAFYYPAEGTNSYVDAMCVPSNARNPELAELYINFMCRPDMAFANAAYTYYASPLDFDAIEAEGNEDYVAALGEYREVMAEVHEDAIEILYGAAASSVPTEPYMNLSPEGLAMLNDYWEELKVESDVSVGIIVLAALVLAVCIGLAVFFAVRARRRKKWRDTLWDTAEDGVDQK